MSEERQRVEITIAGQMLGMDFPRSRLSSALDNLWRQMRQVSPELSRGIRFIPPLPGYYLERNNVTDPQSLFDSEFSLLLLLAVIAEEMDEEEVS